MLIGDVIPEVLGLNEGMAWAKRGNKVVRKYRCTSGRRKGRIVATPAQCFAAPDIKKRIKLLCLYESILYKNYIR